MSAGTQLDLLDLRHYSGRQLRTLLEEEARQWRDLLEWDYTGSIELLLQYLDARILPGYVGLDRGRICGYTFCVYEGEKAVLGDAFAIPSSTEPALEIKQHLLVHLIEMLQHTPHVNRIESQLLLHPAGSLAGPFVQAGFEIHPRLFLRSDLTRDEDTSILPAATEAEPELPPHLRLVRWTNAHFQHAGDLIHRSYVEHLDSVINDQYRSLHGSLRFLHNIVRFPGCGAFDSESSWVLVDQQSGRMEAMILCSLVSPRIGHITQLCVAPDLRGNRYGHMLIRRCAADLHRRGMDAITLTVTESNAHAVKVYRELGFTTRHRFDAMVWNKAGSRVSGTAPLISSGTR